MLVFLRFIIVGIANTIFCYLIFLACYRTLQIPPLVSNGIAYLIGVCISFGANAFFVFDERNDLTKKAAKFAVCFAVAFSLNQVVLWVLNSGNGMPAEFAQLFAMATYTVIFFFMNKHIVFVPTNDSGRD